MNWLALIKSLVALATTLTSWARERNLLSAGETRLLASLHRKEADALALALKAANDASAAIAAGSLPNDGYDRDRPAP